MSAKPFCFLQMFSFMGHVLYIYTKLIMAVTGYVYLFCTSTMKLGGGGGYSGFTWYIHLSVHGQESIWTCNEPFLNILTAIFVIPFRLHENLCTFN